MGAIAKIMMKDKQKQIITAGFTVNFMLTPKFLAAEATFHESIFQNIFAANWIMI